MMHLSVLGCYGGDFRSYFPAFLINGRLLLDSGTIGSALDFEAQTHIQDILITHHHLDHVVALPFFADSIFGRIEASVKIHALPDVLRTLRQHLMNDLLWPDFSKLPDETNPTLLFKEVVLNVEHATSSDLTFIPVPTCHSSVSCGYCILDATSVLVYSGDTGPCDIFWGSVHEALANNPSKKLKALILECSFPNRLTDFANETNHLTPGMLMSELDKFDIGDAQVFIFHMKPQFIREIKMEISEITKYRVSLLRPGFEIDLA